MWRLQLKWMDYRNVEGIYDKIVSIEMFEAVGENIGLVYF